MSRNRYKERRQYRPAFERMMVIYGWLRFPPADWKLNRPNIAARLEVSTKAVQWDIDFLRDRIGMPVYFDHSTNSFKTDPAVKLPWVIRANENEKL